MSYLVNKVNDVAPVNGDIAVSKTISDYMTDTPQDTQAAYKSAQGWKPEFMSADADPLTFCFSAHSFFPFTTDYGTSTPFRYYSSTKWAFTYSNGSPYSVISKDTTYADRLIATEPPAAISYQTNVNMGVTLQAGTYLIRFVPAIDTGSAVWRIYHTDTSNGDPQYLGNHLYHNTNGKAGGHAIGVLSATETRKVYLRALTVSNAYAMYEQAMYRFSIQVQRIGS
jgi:hypothetical protein